jgi:lysophospholipase L1-like esterase
MRPLRWIATVVVLFAVAAAAVAGLNVAVDVFGVHRSSRGRARVVLGGDRFAKYLLNHRYVPENFEGILLGSSMSANWPVGGITSLRVFNDSLDGGNAFEAKRLVDVVVERAGIRTAFVVVSPAFTRSHDFETVVMDRRLWLGSFGSIALLEAYRDLVLLELGRSDQEFDATGTERFKNVPARMNPVMLAFWLQGSEFEVDPVAFAAYRDMVEALRARGVALVLIVPPCADEVLAPKRASFDRYVRRVRAEVARPGDLWLDYTDEAASGFHVERADFADGVHLTPKAAARLVADLDRKVQVEVAAGRLRGDLRTAR